LHAAREIGPEAICQRSRYARLREMGVKRQQFIHRRFDG
jgi:hypothetical protein